MKKKSIQFLLAAIGLSAALHGNPPKGCSTCSQPKQPQPSKMIQQAKAAKPATVPFDVQLELTSGGTITLANLMQEKKAILIDFWATWCGPCIQSLPGLKHKAEILAPQGVAVVAINIDREDDKNKLKAKAEKIRVERKITFPWLIDSHKDPYVDYFDFNSVPRAILISSEGKVLFNGHPEDTEGLGMALNKIGVKL